MSARQGGGQTYLRNLLGSFDPNSGNELYLAIPHSFELYVAGCKIIRPKSNFVVTNPFMRSAWERLHLPGILKKLSIDVLFCPGGVVNTSTPNGCKTVTMFRNMLPFDVQQRKRYPLGYMRLRNWMLEKIMLDSMLHADLVIFIAEFAKEVIEKRAQKELSNSVIIPHGVGPKFLHTSKHSNSRPEWLPSEKYLLYVSTLDYYKCQIEIVQGFALLKNQRRTTEKLVLAGPQNPEYGRKVRSEIRRLGIEEDVVVAGAVSQEELPGLYQHALINVFGSECENCPNTLLEAMASGRPVVASNREPMPEFGGSAVAYFDPSSARDFADTVTTLIDDEDALSQLSTMARERSRHYQWEISARRTWKALQGL
jgi:glycosyltransferase involved in cell wall biosynthesis